VTSTPRMGPAPDAGASVGEVTTVVYLMSTVFLNGQFQDSSQARIGAFDSGFQHGVGLFETLLAVRETGSNAHGVRVLHLHEHLARLAESVRVLGLAQTLRTGALAEAVERTAQRELERTPDTRALRIRLTLTAGDMNLLASARGDASVHEPTLMIHAQPAMRYPDEMFERGVMVTIADWKANPLDQFQGHKTLNYWPRLKELQSAAAKRAGEALVLQVTNHVCGGCVSNIFIAKNGELITPLARGEEGGSRGEHNSSSPGDAADGGSPAGSAAGSESRATPQQGVIPSPVLPGITRRWVMDYALSKDVNVTQRLVTIADVLDADEVFLTNSGWGVLPVVRVEAKEIAQGSVGPLTTDLVAAWKLLA
jgi:branched-chain amino acid aminotransferase